MAGMSRREVRLRAFPTSQCLYFCLESGDWPLDPHEILLHPRDLDKLRVSAYGYVTVVGDSTPGGCGGSRGDHSRRRRRRRRQDINNISTNSDAIPHTFCRAVPDNSLSPGEVRASPWILRAVRDADRGNAEYLLLQQAMEACRGRGDGGVKEDRRTAVTVATEAALAFRVTLTLCDDNARRFLAGAGPTNRSSAFGALKSNDLKLPGGGDGGGCGDGSGGIVGHLDLGRAIARRCSGCLVSPGSLVGVEILGETVVLRVESVAGDAAGNTDDYPPDATAAAATPCGRSSGNPHHDRNRELRDTPAKGSAGGGVDGNDDEDDGRYQGGIGDGKMDGYISKSQFNTPALMGPNTQVSVLQAKARPVEDDLRKNGFGGMKQRFFTRCSAERILWARRAPSLEGVLDELLSLVLLAMGSLNGTGRAATRIPDPATIIESNNSNSNDCSSPRNLRLSNVLPNAVVLSGPSGVGKTLVLDILVEDLRERHGVHTVRLLGPQVLAGFSHGGGSSDGGDRAATDVVASGPAAGTILSKALAAVRNRAPAVLIFDELDAVFDSMGGDGNVGGPPLAEGARVGAALLAVLDAVASTAGAGVAVVGATRRSLSGAGGAGWAGLEGNQESGGGGGGGTGTGIPAAFRQPGRFDRCVEIGPPTQAGRQRILQVLLDRPGLELEPLDSGVLHTSGVEMREKWAPPSPSNGPWSSQSPDVEVPVSGNTAKQNDGGVHDKLHCNMSTVIEGNSGQGRGQETLVEWAKRLSSLTPGMVGGDLDRLVRTARGRATLRSRNSSSRNISNNKPHVPNRSLLLSWQDVVGAVSVTVPRSLKGMDIASASGANSGGGGGPTWASVGGFSKARRRLQRLVQWPWQHPEAFARMGISAPAGALLYGPSGCGKSLVAQVLANECLANFVWVRSSELLSRYLGETEAKLRSLFARARAAAPCILFLDELDSITAKRGDGGMGDAGGGEAGGVYARVLSTLLNEMDGVASGGGTSQPKRQVVDDSPDGVARQGISSGTAESEGSDRSTVSAGGRVLVLAATSRRHMLDSALLRPGRLHESIEFGMPNKEDREGVLRVHARRLPLAAQVDFERLSRDDVAGGLSCADLEASCRDAAMAAMREDLHGTPKVRAEHLQKALAERVAGRLKTKSFTFSLGI